jgi:predicted nucleotidyltransferase
MIRLYIERDVFYMDIIGIIAEFNPFRNGHLYFINKIKELYPNSILVLVLNGFFLERGEISIESKEEKTRLALKYGVDIVLELPCLYGVNSGDYFGDASVKILNELKINKLIFGSECNDISKLINIATIQLNNNIDDDIKKYMDQGDNYPTALNKAIGISLDSPNDLLGVSYIKSIISNKFDIQPISIKRTNDYHDTDSNDYIISASNIRDKIKNNIAIKTFIPEGKINTINYDLLFNLIKHKIITDDNLADYETVDEGLDNKLKNVINDVNSYDELIDAIKTKRYTYNRLNRMLIHILLGIKKNDNNKPIEYIRLLGFNNKGKEYINSIKKDINIPLITKYRDLDNIVKEYEDKAASIYKLLTNDDVLVFENNNKPIITE